MKQRVLCAALALCLCLGIIATAATAFAFPDIADEEVAEAAAVLQGMGIVDGYSDGGFHPGEALTRAQFCKLAILLEGHGDQVQASGYRSVFADLSASHWAAGYVNLACNEGLVAGYGNGAFGPDDPVTVAQGVTILLHLLGYENADIGPFWPEDYMAQAAKLGLTDGISASATGQLSRGDAVELLYAALRQETAQGTAFLSTWSPSSIEGAVVLDADADADDGRAATAQVYAGGTVAFYDQTRTVSAALVGRRGTLLLDKGGSVAGFVPEENAYRTVSVAKVAADGLTDAGGKTYTIASGVSVLVDGERMTWQEGWYEVDGRGTATLYYTAAGSIDLVSFSESERYSGVLLSGYYENAVPNASAPSTVTLLGHTFDVADGAKASLAQFAVGEKMTIALNGAGEVAAAYAVTEKKATAVGVLSSVSGEGATVALLSGIEVSGTVSNTTTASNLVGGLVRVTATGMGKLSVSALSGGSAGGKWDVDGGTIGTLSVSGQVKVYDQVGGSAVTAVDPAELVLDTIPAKSITYVGTNAAGEVDLIVLDDVTGSCYTYGFLQAGTQSGGSGELTYTNNTAAVENSAGTGTAYVLAGTVKDEAPGGLAVTTGGKVAGVVYLTQAPDVSRADFSGGETVLADGYYLPIADGVEVYNRTNGTWMTLAEARAYAETFTVYYDKAPAEGGQVRLIVVK